MSEMFWTIRYATLADIPAITAIARQYPKELPFISRVQLTEAISKPSLPTSNLSLLICESDGIVRGFVRFRACRDGWQTIYDLAVDKATSRVGIGRALLYAVPCPVRLKCTADNETANRFYKNAGMAFAGVETGKKRNLNKWERGVLSIFVMGGKFEIPDIARRSGMAYGTRHDKQPFDWPFMLDIKWDDYDWTDYMHKVCTWRPVQAMCADYERPSQRRELYRQIRDLRAAGVLRVKVCPKFNGATAHIPSWCICAFSVPSGYAGFIPPSDEFAGRRWHLLGGTPQKQLDWITKIAGHGGRVISIDGNSHETAAKRGSTFDGSRWVRKPTEEVDYLGTMAVSGRNIARAMNAASGWKQLGLNWGES